MTGETFNNDHNNHGEFTDKHFKLIKNMLYDSAGITLADRKKNMVYNRIVKRLKKIKLSTFDEYIDYLNNNRDQEISDLVNALTTNVTHFFREEHHFDHLKKETTRLINDGQKKIRIWSAGCSIGAEPYSMAITMQAMMEEEKTKADIKILATDIDTTALEYAKKRKYQEKNIKGLTKAHLSKYFQSSKVDNETVYKLKDNIRNMVSFNYLNLNEEPWPMRGPFDFIFCRNVFIYFDRDKQQQYVANMTKLLKTGGYLCLGHSEHFASDDQNYKTCGQTTYQKIT